MKAFQLPARTQAKLVKATPHKEFDGKNPLKQAISLSLEATLSLGVLAQINPNIPGMLVRRREIDPQQQVDGVQPVLFEVLVPELALPIGIDGEFSGYTTLIDRATGDLELYGCKVGKLKVKEVTPHEGENVTAVVAWSIGSDEKITEELVGALCAMEAGDIWLGQKAPDKPVEEAAKTKARSRKAALEQQGQQRLTEATGAEIDASTGQGPTPESVLADAVAREAGDPEHGPDDEDPPAGDGEGSDPDAAPAANEPQAGETKARGRARKRA
jgi:hypothetical protein